MTRLHSSEHLPNTNALFSKWQVKPYINILVVFVFFDGECIPSAFHPALLQI